MNKRTWLIPTLIIAANALAIILKWRSLPEILPAHFDLEGNAGGTMPRTMLLIYPLISAAICIGAYMIAQKKQKLQNGLIILTSGISLTVFSSAMVTLTMGTMPMFMLAEPVILLAAVAGFAVCAVKARKKIIVLHSPQRSNRKECH